MQPMTIDPHVRELLRFEEQRIGTPIALSDTGQRPPTSVILLSPEDDATFQPRECLLGDGSVKALALADVTGSDVLVIATRDGTVPVAAREAHVVRLAFHPAQLTGHGDRPL